MKETGIIMSGNHPQLIIDGTKTMTRRTRGLQYYNEKPDKWRIQKTEIAGKVWWEAACDLTWSHRIDCPYGQVGDRLWVRETHYLCVDADQKLRGDTVYKASEANPDICKGEWRPSIHMPRWASRILLEITEVRVERVQEISEEDAVAEGCRESWSAHSSATVRYTARHEFKELWDSLNAKRGFGWDFNPWVWVILFKLVNQ